MIDPLIRLAMSIQSAPGAYALLLGSGVSRPSGIKTGYEVLLDLIGRVAVASGASPGEDPEAWYRSSFNEEPDYSQVLERLATRPAERQALLRGYFEPTDDERETGAKLPSKAHRAIAQLVASGYVRVIITTNFDRLVEQALIEAGVQPYIVRSAADVGGLPPASQIRCLLVKVHGDYLDARLRNTLTELGSFPKVLDKLLDRLLDEYALVVCGWSSDWDPALRAAVRRTPNRRLTSYWTTRGSPSTAAADLIANRSATVVAVGDADTFFDSLLDKVLALEDLRLRPPATNDLAISETKRLVANPSGRIRLRDLVKGETDRLLGAIAGVQARPGEPSADEFLARVQIFEQETQRLAAIAASVGRWGQAENFACLVEAVERLGNVPRQDGLVHLNELRRLPALLVFAAAGVGALSAGAFSGLGMLFDSRVRDESRYTSSTAVETLSPSSILAGILTNNLRNRATAKPPQTFHTPQSDELHDAVRPALSDALPEDDAFDRAFNSYELLAGLAFADRRQSTWGLGFPPGRYMWQIQMYGGEGGALAMMAQELESAGAEWPPVTAGIFPTSARATELIAALGEQIRRSGMSW